MNDKVEFSEMSSRIVGGTTEPDGQFPWVVTVSNPSNFTCHGVFISAHYVVTAAHCLQNAFSGVTVSYSRNGVSFSQTGVVGNFNAGWDPHNPTAGHDIGAVCLPASWAGMPGLEPAQLPGINTSPAIGTSGTLASGSATPGAATVLRGPVVSGSACLANPDEFCVQSPTASLCPGDSGSGFITNANGVNVVRGIAVNVADPSCTTVNQPFTATNVGTYSFALSLVQAFGC